jgi:ABC-2 family transporter protein
MPSAFSVSARFILMQMVADKQTKMRETLKIMSMKTGAYGLSYFLSQVIYVIFTTIAFTVAFLLNNVVQGINGFYLVLVLFI